MTLRHSFLGSLAIFCGLASLAHASDYQYGSYRGSNKFPLGGLVIGAAAGFTWGETEFSVPGVPGAEFTDDLDGWEGGLLVGYEFTNGPYFTGFELLGAYGGPQKDYNLGGGVRMEYGVEGHIELRIRAGALAADRVAVYGIAGATSAKLESEGSDGLNSFEGDEWRWGWVAGGGLEFLLTPTHSVAVEYTYTGLEEKTYAGILTIDGDFHAVRAAGRARF
jgi:opacity protein-like surface antigen